MKQQLSVDIDPATRSMLETYVTLLQSWNRRINLVGHSGTRVVWERHINDCLQLASFIGEADEFVDIGSGAGLPGLIVALATGVPGHLIEADRRRAAFLHEARRVTGARVTVHAARAELVKLPPVAIVTARAVAPLITLIGFALPFLAAGGSCLFLKGRTVDDELTEAKTRWQMKVERYASTSDPNACILRVSAIEPLERVNWRT